MRDAAEEADERRRSELECWIQAMCNFELHLRKVFWVDDALSLMLGATALDITGDALRLPFASFALVFTDRYALGLAERMLSRDDTTRLRGKMLHALTVYVIHSERSDDSRTIRVALACDTADGRMPELVVRDLAVRADARLDEILDSRVEDSDAALLEPIFAGSPSRRLLHLVVNAILYASSADAEREGTQAEPSPGAPRPAKRIVGPSDEVYFLPGTIDIETVEQLGRLRRGGTRQFQLVRRCMVRGHWRRASADWKDQRPRWIKPHWRGPKAAAIIEKQYRLRP